MAISAERPHILQHPEWLTMDWLVHGFSTRPGGYSTVYSSPGCGELNLGFTPADDREVVIQNRNRLLKELLGGDPPSMNPRLTTLSQVHSDTVHTVDFAHAAPPPGDGLITATPGIYLAIQTADCVPVLVVDQGQRVVAAFHAGWRGTAQRIVEKGVGRMREEFDSQPEDLSALIGPAIGPCCYAVGEDLRQAFEAQFSYASDLFETKAANAPWPTQPGTGAARWESVEGAAPSSIHLDLIEANRPQLLDAGLHADKIHRVGGCTHCRPDLYFSHRQSQGHTGRMMSVVGILNR